MDESAEPLFWPSPEVSTAGQSPSHDSEVYNNEVCRDFIIHELGHRFGIPQQWRYSEGIQEVRKRLMTRFGDQYLAKAMGLFEEILEQDDANGMGEDGDLWRTWRHSYKHRHDDFSNPGTPRFPNLVLPTPVAPKHSSTALHSSLNAINDNGPSTSQSTPITAEIARQRVCPRVLGWDDGNQGRAEIIQELSEEQWILRAQGLSQSHEYENFESRVTRTTGSRPFSPIVHNHTAQEPSPADQTADQHSASHGLKRRFSRVFSPATFTRKLKFRSPWQRNQEEKKLPPLAQRRAPNLPPLTLDGACDEHDGEPTHMLGVGSQRCSEKPYDCNSVSFHLRNTSTNNSSSSVTLYPSSDSGEIHDFKPKSTPPTATHYSSDQSITSKQKFRDLTRGLITARSGPQAPRVTLDLLNPEKYDPKSPENYRKRMSEEYHEYLNVSRQNPFTQNPFDYVDDGAHLSEIYEDYRRMTPHMNKSSSSSFRNAVRSAAPKVRGLGHSYSENNIPSHVTTFPASPPKTGYSKLDNVLENPFQSPQFERGRGRDRTGSPFKEISISGQDSTSDYNPHSPPRRSRSPMKKMFGDNGWLGRSTSLKDTHNHQSGLKMWSGNIKHRVADMADFTKKLANPFNNQDTARDSPFTSKFPVSLDPPTQSKLYSEIELMLLATANRYLMTQRSEGRISIESLVKVTQYWRGKNRPGVIEFQYDQLTQHDLVFYNVKSVRFYGPNADHSQVINAMMIAWKSMAKEMSVRTFCNPDSMIRKHMHDCYKILEMLGAPLVTFLAFQEIQVNALETMREEQKKRDEYESIKFGVERVWKPTDKTLTKDEAEDAGRLFMG